MRLAAVGLLGAATLVPQAALALNGMPLHATPAAASVHRAVSGVKPAALRLHTPRRAGVSMSSEAAKEEKAWSAAGMTVEDFYSNSIGSWRSLRSSHNIAFAQLEVNSDIDIMNVGQDDAELIEVLHVVRVCARMRVRVREWEWGL